MSTAVILPPVQSLGFGNKEICTSVATSVK